MLGKIAKASGKRSCFTEGEIHWIDLIEFSFLLHLLLSGPPRNSDRARPLARHTHNRISLPLKKGGELNHHSCRTESKTNEFERTRGSQRSISTRRPSCMISARWLPSAATKSSTNTPTGQAA
jgi:hypothetical protein